MRVNPVSIHSNYKANTNNIKKQNVNNKYQSFGSAYLGFMDESQIKRLYESGPKILEIVHKIMPVLSEKTGNLLRAEVDVYPDFFRTLSINVSMDRYVNNVEEKLMKYIVDNNHKLGFPKKLIDFYKNKDRDYIHYFDNQLYCPFSVEMEKMGYNYAKERLAKFLKESDKDSFLRDLFYMYNDKGEVYKKPLSVDELYRISISMPIT